MTRIRRNDGGLLTFQFEELQPIQGYRMFVEGEADIEWSWEKGDFYSGYLGGFVWSVKSISIYKDGEGGALNLGGEYDRLYSWIEEALERDFESSILNAIEEQSNYIRDEDD